MATTTHTIPTSGTEPSVFTLDGFCSVILSIIDVVEREEQIDADFFDKDIDLGSLQDAAQAAWHRAEASISAFLRANRNAPSSSDLVDVAERIDAVLSLNGIECRDDLFGCVTDVMVMRACIPAGSAQDDLVAAALPWLYRLSIRQVPYVPLDADDPGLIAA